MDSIRVRRWLPCRSRDEGDTRLAEGTTRDPRKRTRRPGVEGLEERQLLATSLPDIAMVSATTRDSQSLTITYDVTGKALDAPVLFGVYRSADDRLDASDLLIGSVPVSTGGGEPRRSMRPGGPPGTWALIRCPSRWTTGCRPTRNGPSSSSSPTPRTPSPSRTRPTTRPHSASTSSAW